MMPARGEVWLFDLGMEGKVRPALVVSTDYGESDRALITIVPHTTSLRGSDYEIPVRVPFLKPAIRKLGALRTEQFDVVFAGLLRWLGYPAQAI